MRELKRRLFTVLAVLAATIAIGTAGFVVIDDYPLFDALYMALITVTTVGYAEVHPLSHEGRIFNVGFVLFGVAVMFYAIGVMTQTILELQLSEFFEKRRVKRMIEKLKNHYIICGFGRVGRAAAAELKRTGVPFVVADTDPAVVEHAIKRGMLAVSADAKSDETLRELGVHRAKGLIAALATDADNLFLILSAKALNPRIKVASRVNEEESENKFRRAGADAVFRPYDITGYRLAQAILRPFVFEFLDITSSTVDMGLNIGLEQVEVPAGCELAGKSLKDTQLRREYDVIVLAIRKADGDMQFNPPAEAVVEAGDHLIVMGNLEHLQQLAERTRGARR